MLTVHLDDFIFFRRLSKHALRDIVDIRLSELQSRLADRRIHLRVNDNVKDWLADRGYDPRYGARPLNRLISSQVGNRLADRIIKGELRDGQNASVLLRDKDDILDVVPSD